MSETNRVNRKNTGAAIRRRPRTNAAGANVNANRAPAGSNSENRRRPADSSTPRIPSTPRYPPAHKRPKSVNTEKVFPEWTAATGAIEPPKLLNNSGRAGLKRSSFTNILSALASSADAYQAANELRNQDVRAARSTPDSNFLFSNSRSHSDGDRSTRRDFGGGGGRATPARLKVESRARAGGAA